MLGILFVHLQLCVFVVFFKRISAQFIHGQASSLNFSSPQIYYDTSSRRLVYIYKYWYTHLRTVAPTSAAHMEHTLQKNLLFDKDKRGRIVSQQHASAQMPAFKPEGQWPEIELRATIHIPYNT